MIGEGSIKGEARMGREGYLEERGKERWGDGGGKS